MKALTNISEFMEYFPKHSKSNIKIFLAVVTCMLTLRTTCLYKCKDKMAGVTQKGKTKAMSHYKQIIRFFKLTGIRDFCEGIFVFILCFMGIESDMIIIDRTNWKIGKKNVNLLTAGVLFHNCFIPLCWEQLDKRGNSNFEERRLLVNRFIRIWEKAGKSIKGMIAVADREFIGPEWLGYLHEMTFHFVFRLRDNMYFSKSKTGKKTAIA